MDRRQLGSSEIGYWVRKEVITRIQISFWLFGIIFIILWWYWSPQIENENEWVWFVNLTAGSAISLFSIAIGFRRFIKSLKLESREP